MFQIFRFQLSIGPTDESWNDGRMSPPPLVVKMLALLKMYLMLEVLLEGLAFVLADHFHDLAEMSHFTVVDTVRVSLWRADLVLEVDLREIFEAIAATCSLTRFNNASLPSTDGRSTTPDSSRRPSRSTTTRSSASRPWTTASDEPRAGRSASAALAGSGARP